MHIAHNEGNYFCTSDQLKEINDNDQIALIVVIKMKKYKMFNPNGSIENIMGYLIKKNVLGMMPHPERMMINHYRVKMNLFF